MKEWALYYADLGLAVLPLKPPRILGQKKPGKEPMTQHGVKDATTDKIQIEQWWDSCPDANIGIATGSRSDGLVVIDLDIDEDKGINGYEVLKEWQQEHGELPETWQSITGRGGYHIFYKDAAHNSNRAGLYEGVDVRGEGGYVVAPPSLHENGKQYEWEQEPGEFEIALVNNKVASFLLGPPVLQKAEGFQLPETIPEGQRVTSLVSLIGSQRAKGLSTEAIRAAVQAENKARCVPPLTDQELDKEVFPALERNWEATNLYMREKSHSAIFAIFAPIVKNQNKKLIPFPVKCLPDVIQNYAEAVAESLQVPKDMVASLLLVAMSLCIQGKFWLNVKPDWTESLNLYVVVVGRPSERKTPTLNEIMKPISDYVAKENERREPEIAKYKLERKIITGKLKNIEEALAKKNNKSYTIQDALECQEKLRDLEKEEVKPLRLIVDDVTPEALIRAMKDNEERMGIVSAEGGIFGMMAGRYNANTNIDIFLKGYSGEYYSSIRVGSGTLDLIHPYLTMGLAVQPQVITDIMENKDFRGRGLLARFLYSVPNTRVGERVYRTQRIEPSIRAEYEKLCTELLDAPDLTGFAERIIKLSQGADRLAEEYYLWIEEQLNNELESIEDWAGKLHGNTMRIAGVLHVVKHRLNSVNVLLEEDTMSAAIEIGKYFIEHSKAAFDLMGLSDPPEVQDAKYIISRLEQNSKNSKIEYISKRDLFDLCKGHMRNVEEMEPGLQCLIEHGYIAIVKESQGRGRPTEKIYINPEYYKWKESQKQRRDHNV